MDTYAHAHQHALVDMYQDSPVNSLKTVLKSIVMLMTAQYIAVQVRPTVPLLKLLGIQKIPICPDTARSNESTHSYVHICTVTDKDLRRQNILHFCLFLLLRDCATIAQSHFYTIPHFTRIMNPAVAGGTHQSQSLLSSAPMCYYTSNFNCTLVCHCYILIVKIQVCKGQLGYHIEDHNYALSNCRDMVHTNGLST